MLLEFVNHGFGEDGVLLREKKTQYLGNLSLFLLLSIKLHAHEVKTTSKEQLLDSSKMSNSQNSQKAKRYSCYYLVM